VGKRKIEGGSVVIERAGFGSDDKLKEQRKGSKGRTFWTQTKKKDLKFKHKGERNVGVTWWVGRKKTPRSSASITGGKRPLNPSGVGRTGTGRQKKTWGGQLFCEQDTKYRFVK